jgi:hypothetical protein
MPFPLLFLQHADLKFACLDVNDFFEKFLIYRY